MITFLALVVAATVPKNSEAMTKDTEKFPGGLLEKFPGGLLGKFPHDEARVKRSATPNVDKEALAQKWRETHPHADKLRKTAGLMDDAKMAELIEKYKASRQSRHK